MEYSMEDELESEVLQLDINQDMKRNRILLSYSVLMETKNLSLEKIPRMKIFD